MVKGTVSSSKKIKGEWRTSFLDFVAFGKTAEVISANFGPGKAITLYGDLDQDEWVNKQGEKRSKLQLSVRGFDFSARDKDGASQNANNLADNDSPF